MKNRKFLIPIIILTLLLVIFVYISAVFYYGEGKYSRHSIQYRLFTSPVIKNIPTSYAGSDIVYWKRFSDGNRPPSDGVFFSIASSRDVVFDQMCNYFENIGFKKNTTGSSDDMVLLSLENETVEIRYSSTLENSMVSIVRYIETRK
jgi:hypothetical protein